MRNYYQDDKYDDFVPEYKLNWIILIIIAACLLFWTAVVFIAVDAFNKTEELERQPKTDIELMPSIQHCQNLYGTDRTEEYVSCVTRSPILSTGQP